MIPSNPAPPASTPTSGQTGLSPKVLGLILGGLVLVYLVPLLVVTYLSLVKLRDSTIERFRQDTEKVALTLGYFFSERRIDLKNLQKNPSLALFFENQALGMSMKYGLQDSLEAIAQTFSYFIADRQLGDDLIYTGFALVDPQGKTIIEKNLASTPTGRVGDMLPLCQSDKVTPEIFAFRQDQVCGIVVAAPFHFKGSCVAHLLAFLSVDAIYHHLMHKSPEATDHFATLTSATGDLVCSPALDANPWLSPAVREDLKTLHNGINHLNPSHQYLPDEVLAVKVPIPGTNFFLINVISGEVILGQLDPTHILVVMATLTVFIVGGIVLILRAHNRNLVLEARFSEAAARQQEMTEKNRQLNQEIEEHRLTENALRQTQDQLAQKHKMEALGTLAGGVAHDINNLLTPMLGYTDLVLRQLPVGNAARGDMSQVLRSGLRLKELVEQILTFSRLTPREKIPVRLDAAINEVAKLLRASLPATINILTDIDDQALTILAVPAQVHQLLMNLCTNAYQAMRVQGGTLTISLHNLQLQDESPPQYGNLPPRTCAELTIQDTGEGMTPEVQRRIFDPYFTTKTKAEGTGLGLAIVHGIVKDCGGEIFVDSARGQGSAFRIVLPTVSASPHQDVFSEKTQQGHGERILLVDDEKDVALVMQRQLQHLGYSVTTRSEGQEALTDFSCTPQSFDLVISDMTMPNLTGDLLAQAILRLRPDIPIILCTGYSDLIDHERARALGISRLLLKPVIFDKLAATVREVLSSQPLS
jgi:signal transduction histidine kinase/CheY-like chemotaxis protein